MSGVATRSPRRAIIEIGFYLIGVALYFLFVVVFYFERKSTVARAGKITFFGAKSFVADGLKAINEELPKYDPALRQLLCHGPFHLAISDQTTESDKTAGKICAGVGIKNNSRQQPYLSNPAAGLFGVPETTWKRGPEGICQLVVYRFFQTVELGQGLKAAIRRTDLEFKKAALTRARERMREWLTKVNYPSGWIDHYPMQRPINPSSATRGPNTSRPSC